MALGANLQVLSLFTYYAYFAFLIVNVVVHIFSWLHSADIP